MNMQSKQSGRSFWTRLLCCLLTAALVWPMNIQPAQAADMTLVDDDFSSYPAGEFKAGAGNTWSTQGAVPAFQVVESVGTKHLNIVHGGTGSSYVGQRFAAQSGGTIIEFDLNIPSSNGGTLWVTDGNINATSAAALRYQLDNGVIRRHNSNQQIQYDTNTWYRFHIVFNAPAKSYTTTITNLTTEEKVVWPDAFYSDRSKISGLGWFVNAGGSFNLTNVSIHVLDLALSRLALQAGSQTPMLVPAFDPKVTDYELEVPHSVDTLEVTAEASFGEGVAISVGQTSLDSGGSISVPLTGTQTLIETSVTSNVHTDIKRVYRVTVNKLPVAPNVLHPMTEAKDGKVLLGWEQPADPAYAETRIYAKNGQGELTLADTVPSGRYIAAIPNLTNGSIYDFVIKAVYEYEDGELTEAEGVEVDATPNRLPARQMEGLDRGIVAVKQENHVYVGWRLLGTDPESIAFNVYRDGVKVNGSPIAGSTNFADTGGKSDSVYTVRSIVNGKEHYTNGSAIVWDTSYLDIPIRKPEDGVTPKNEAYSYRANDATVADLDGDGEYEIILKWDPTNSKDNSQSGYTGNVYVDAYKLDGTRLWRIDLGRNIRAGAHYLDIMAYDLDGDGKAEITFRTADGTIDGEGNVIGDAEADYRNADGYILSGPEFHTVFDGLTGKALDTAPYEPVRGNVSDWGDGYGNRVDRFLAAVAYLDGERPSIIMQRGYYTRMVLVAYNFRNGKLEKLWTFDSNADGNGSYAGQGNHQISIGDVDGDGRDEIITGPAAIDHDGKPLWNSQLGHGDAMHLGDLDPNRLGLELFAVQENTAAKYSSNLKDAGTGRVLWGQMQTGIDTGRGLSADIDPRYEGAESWSIDGAWNSRTGAMYAANGELIGTSIPSSNFAIWWDGDLSRELLDHNWHGDPTRVGTPTIEKWDYENQTLIPLQTLEGTFSNNDTKGNPSLQADLLGDWREEVLVRTEDSSALRLYTTTDVTEHRIHTLMHDPLYRLGIAWQNTGYNQPPHTSFFLGTGMQTPERPNIYTNPLAAETEVPGSEPGPGSGYSPPAGSEAHVEKGRISQTVSADSSGKARMELRSSELSAALAGAVQELVIELHSSEPARTMELALPASALRAAAANGLRTVRFSSGQAAVTIEAEQLASALKEGAATVTLVVELTDASSLSEASQRKLTTAKAYELSILIDGAALAYKDGIKLELAYVLQQGQSPSQVVLLGRDKQGLLQIIKHALYNAENGTLAWLPNPLGQYAAAYASVELADLAAAIWAQESISALAAREVVHGYEDGTFKPNRIVTRAEFVTMLMNVLDVSDSTDQAAFTDSGEGDWHFGPLAAANRLGIVMGKGNGSFGVNDPITRQEMAVIAYRAVQAIGLQLDAGAEKGQFADQEQIDGYAVQAVTAMQAAGIIQGMGDGSYKPQATASRAQSSIILYKLLKLLQP